LTDASKLITEGKSIPTICYEFAYDTAVLAQREGIKDVFVSNGYLSSEAARQIAPYLDYLEEEGTITCWISYSIQFKTNPRIMDL
jgi:hypothetical protein